MNALAPEMAHDLLSSSEVGRLMQSKDWSASPLRDPQTWPASLRAVVSLMLGSKFAMFTAWGPELGLLYNDAYAEILGAKHPTALGAAFEEVWSEIWTDIRPLIDAALSGNAVYRENLPLMVNRRGTEEQAWFTFSYSPVRDESGAVAGMFCAVNETTAAVRSEQRKSFRLKLDEALLQAVEAREVMDAAMTALGQFLGAQRVGYSRLDPDGEHILMESCYANGVPPLLGTYKIDDFGPERWTRGLLGETEVCDDVAADPAATQAIWAALKTRAFVSVPLIRDGRLKASLYVNYDRPHAWTPEEVSLVEHVAARTWDALERAQAEAGLRESEARFRNMADHAPVMMWITDQSGRCTYLNRVWYEFTGQSQDEALGFGWLEATHPEDRARAEEVFRLANAARSSFRVEYRLRLADGGYRWALDAASPRFGAAGEFLGYVGSVIDIQDRREAEESIRRNEMRLRRLMNAMPAFAWLADPSGELTYFNDRWYAYTGQTPETALPHGWALTLHPEDAEMTAAAWAQARAVGEVYEVEMRYRRADGQYRWHLARAEPVHDDEELVTAWMGASIDIHESKLAAEHQGLLINELNHRVKNTLATVQSMAAQSLRSGGDPKAAHEAFMARLMALSAAHNVLTEERWAGAEIEDVVLGAVRTFSEPGERFRTAGPNLRLRPKAALAISMALHELGTNASKYGALGSPAGWVSLDWEAPGPGRLRMVWREHDGPLVAPPQQKGFGSRLLERGLAAELAGEVHLDFRPDGLVCTIEADLTAAA